MRRRQPARSGFFCISRQPGSPQTQCTSRRTSHNKLVPARSCNSGRQSIARGTRKHPAQYLLHHASKKAANILLCRKLIPGATRFSQSTDAVHEHSGIAQVEAEGAVGSIKPPERRMQWSPPLTEGLEVGAKAYRYGRPSAHISQLSRSVAQAHHFGGALDPCSPSAQSEMLWLASEWQK